MNKHEYVKVLSLLKEKELSGMKMSDIKITLTVDKITIIVNIRNSSSFTGTKNSYE